jgi:hypothetical protein
LGTLADPTIADVDREREIPGTAEEDFLTMDVFVEDAPGPLLLEDAGTGLAESVAGLGLAPDCKYNTIIYMIQ